MRVNVFRCALIVCVLCIPCVTAMQSAESTVDMLDYLLQKDDKGDAWTLSGTDVRWSKDPDGTSERTFVLNKFSSPHFYEAFKVTDNQIQIRYEVFRPGGKNNWIRRFEEIAGEGKAPGALWCNRYMELDKGIMSNYRQDRLVFDEKTQSYVIDRSGCVEEFSIYIWVTWAQNDCRGLKNLDFKPEKVLRLVSEWQREGKMVEWYDYSKGKGLVAWRWLERISTLKPSEQDRTGRIFHCENGYVYIVSPGDADSRPIVRTYDVTTGKRGDLLEVVQFTSHWFKDQDPQWYVIYRNSLKEWGLQEMNERVRHDFSLPEWKTKPGATIKDLPHLYTHPVK